MASLILSRRFYEQPQGTVAIDDNGPDVACIIPSLFMQELVSQAALSSVGTKQAATNSLDRDGVLYDFDGTTLSALSLPRPRIYTADTPFSFAWRGAIRSTGTNGLLFGEFNTLNSWVRVDDGGNRIIFTNASGVSTVLSNVFGGEVNSWLLTSDGGGTGASTLRLYKNGALVVTSAGTITPSFTLDSVGCAYNSASFAYNGTLLYFFAWDRQLRAQDAVEIHENPWQLFRATPRRIYFGVATATTYNQTLSATATGSASAQTVRALLSSISASSAATASYLRSVSLARNVSSTASPTVSRSVSTTKSASSSGTPTLSASKSVLSSLSASATCSAVMARTVGLIRTASSAATAALSRTVSLIRSVTGTGTATLSFPSNAQYLRPDSNVTQTSFTGGFAEIDETTASDADFAYGTNNTAAILEVGLSNPTGTPGGGTTTVRYRIAKTNAGTVDGGGSAVTVTAAVYQGTTLISADAAQTATGTWTQYSWAPSMAGVTDWNDLRLRFTTSASGGTAANRRGGAVSWAEVQTPAASSGTEKTLSASATATATIQSLRALISSLSATATGSASTSRVVSMVRSVTSSAAASVTRVVAVTKSATSTATASVSRMLNKAAMAVTSSATATLIKATATAMTLTAAATGSAVMSSLFGLVLSASAAGTALYTRAISLSRAVTATGAASVTRGIAKALNAAASAIASLVKQASSAAISALRTLAVAAENRIRSVSAESRIHPADAEDRDLPQ